MPTPGQIAYEADVAAYPLYHDGTPRPHWHELCDIAKWSWERNPTPRHVALLLAAREDEPVRYIALPAYNSA